MIRVPHAYIYGTCIIHFGPKTGLAPVKQTWTFAQKICIYTCCKDFSAFSKKGIYMILYAWFFICTYIVLKNSLKTGDHIYRLTVSDRAFLLFLWSVIPPAANFDLVYARHSWPLSMQCQGSLTCHIYCDTGPASVCNIHFRGSVTITPVAKRLVVELSVQGLFLRPGSVAAGIRTRSNLLHVRRTLLPTAPSPRPVTEEHRTIHNTMT